MLAGLAPLAGKGFTMESSDKISVYQSTFRPSEFTSHFDEKDIMRYMCKLDRLDITDPYHAPGVLFYNYYDSRQGECFRSAVPRCLQLSDRISLSLHW